MQALGAPEGIERGRQAAQRGAGKKQELSRRGAWPSAEEHVVREDAVWFCLRAIEISIRCSKYKPDSIAHVDFETAIRICVCKLSDAPRPLCCESLDGILMSGQASIPGLEDLTLKC